MIGDIRRVTAGYGGESLLIIGSSKAAVYDTGMAYCGRLLVENIKKELKGRTPDYVLLSHTHYDHVGGLPYLIEEWPDIIVYGSAHGKKIFENPRALSVIRNLSEHASKKYLGNDSEPLNYKDENIRIDKTVGEGDIISLGDRYFRVYETMGHTKCSLTYFLENESILLASESTGVMLEGNGMHASILSSYKDTVESIGKCRALGAKHILCPHYLQVEDEIVSDYWDTSLKVAEDLKTFICGCLSENLTEEEILKMCKMRYWSEDREKQQPLEAFMINMKAAINVFKKEI